MNFDPTTIIAGLVFGGIGFVAFIYGKKETNFKAMLTGAALIAYPYFIADLILTVAIGVALTASLFIFRD